MALSSLTAIKGNHVTEAHLFTTLGWNLCGRSETTAAIHSRHIDWDNDALLIGICKSKRSVKEEATYFKVFSNPYDPATCPVLALALHCVCNIMVMCSGSHGQRLFHDTKGTKTRLSKAFKDIAKLLNLEGLGTHSIRKGAITLSATGTCDFAPVIATILRARWNTTQLGCILKYAKMEGAGVSPPPPSPIKYLHTYIYISHTHMILYRRCPRRPFSSPFRPPNS